MPKTNHNLKANDILSCSWGYEQTNVDFYIVLAATPKTITLQEIGSTEKATGSMTAKVMPDKTKRKGKPFRRTVITKWGGEFVKIKSYSRATKWSDETLFTSSYA